MRSNVPRLIWNTGIVGSSRLRVRAREERAVWVIVAGALKGGCKEGTIEGVRKMIFEEGWVRSCCQYLICRDTNGKKDWIREIGPRIDVSKVSCQVSVVIVSIGPVGYGLEALKINPAR